MKKHLSAIKTALSKINKTPLYILTAGIILSAAFFTLSYALQWHFTQNGGLAETINDITALRNMTPAVLTVSVIIACLYDLIRRRAEEEQ